MKYPKRVLQKKLSIQILKNQFNRSILLYHGIKRWDQTMRSNYEIKVWDQKLRSKDDIKGSWDQRLILNYEIKG